MSTENNTTHNDNDESSDEDLEKYKQLSRNNATNKPIQDPEESVQNEDGERDWMLSGQGEGDTGQREPHVREEETECNTPGNDGTGYQNTVIGAGDTVDAHHPQESRGNQPQESRGNPCQKCMEYSIVKKLRKFVIPTLSLLFYGLDIGTDIEIAVSSLQTGDWLKGILTVIFLTLSSLIITILDIKWVWKDYCDLTNDETEGARKPRKRYAWIHTILSALSLGILGRIWRYLDYIYHYLKMIDTTGPVRKWHKDTARDREKDSAILGMFEGFFEAAPQLALKVYLVLRSHHPGCSDYNKMGVSVGAMAFAYTAHYKINRAVGAGRDDTPFYKLIFYAPSVLACLISRYLTFIYFAYYVSTCTVVIFSLLHVIVLFVWITFILKPSFEGMHLGRLKCIFQLMLSIVMLNLYLNLSENPDNKVGRQMSIFYVGTHLETLIFAFLLYCYRPDLWIYSVVVIVCIVLHSLLLYFHYQCLHPTTGKYCVRVQNRQEERATNSTVF